MKLVIINIFLLFGIASAQSSSKYFIYFKDKGADISSQLQKSSVEYTQAVSSLSQRSIERRKKNLGEDFISEEDLPIAQKYVDIVEKYGIKIIRKLKWFNAVSAYLEKEQVEELKKIKFVEKIEKVKTLKSIIRTKEEKLGKVLEGESTNYLLNYGPSLTQNKLSDVPFAHDMGFAGNGVLIGILDAGFAWEEHTALQTRNVLAERDFVNGDNNTDDGDANHGTAVFSLLGGFHEGSMIGPAYDAQFALAKTEFISTETHVEEDNYVAGLQWMDSLGVDITSTSLGYSEFDKGEGNYTYQDLDGNTTIVTKASEVAFSKGILTVTSAGNEGNDPWKYITAPGDGFNTITVGAVNSQRKIASYSSVGPTYDGRIKPEVVAQGSSCYHAAAYSSTSAYSYGSGTSYSGPIVAGISAQLLSAYPHLTNKQMREIIIAATDSTNTPNNQYGYGLLSIKRALEYPNIMLANANSGEQVSTIQRLFTDVVSDSVYMLYKVNSGSSISEQRMTNTGKSIYSAPYYGEIGDTVKFWFEYMDLSSNLKRLPSDGNYLVINGQSSVKLSLNSEPHNPIPDNFELTQNFPNPFNPLTQFVLNVPVSEFITIEVTNVLGQKVKTIASKYHASGTYPYFWDGTDDFGVSVASGVYIYSAISKSKLLSKKMMLLK